MTAPQKSHKRHGTVPCLANQYNKRITLFPDAKIDFLVDVYGRDYTQEMLDDILRLVKNKIGDKVVIEFLYD